MYFPLQRSHWFPPWPPPVCPEVILMSSLTSCPLLSALRSCWCLSCPPVLHCRSGGHTRVFPGSNVLYCLSGGHTDVLLVCPPVLCYLSKDHSEVLSDFLSSVVCPKVTLKSFLTFDPLVPIPRSHGWLPWPPCLLRSPNVSLMSSLTALSSTVYPKVTPSHRNPFLKLWSSIAYSKATLISSLPMCSLLSTQRHTDVLPDH